jgi:hypothetical protein
MIDPEYFAKKRLELGLDREDDLARVQGVLDTWYPGRVRARRLHQGVLRVVTPSAGVASELRMRQMELLDVTGMSHVRLMISIGTI